MLVLQELSYLVTPPTTAAVVVPRQFIAWGPLGPIYVNESATADLEYNAVGIYVNEQP